MKAGADGEWPLASAPQGAPLGLSQDVAIRDSLLVIAEDIATHAGFGAVVMSVRHSADEFKVVAVAGDARVRVNLLDSIMPLQALISLLQTAQPWGDLRFIADAAAHPAAGTGRWSWMDDGAAPQPAREMAGSAWSELPWRRENALVAPMVREDGELLGFVSVDLPTNGLRPDERQRLTLSVYAHQAERTVVAAESRVHKSHHLLVAQAARHIVREAGLQHQVADLLPKARTALLDHLGLRQAWIKSSSLTTPTEGLTTRTAAPVPLMAPAAVDPQALPPSLLQPLSRIAQRCWDEQRVLVLSSETTSVPGMQAHEVLELMDFLAQNDVASALIVPLGSGDLRLGSMVLGRSADGRDWSTAEKGVILDIGHDLGRAMVHTLWFEAQLLATEELRQHAEHKRQLMMTMSHELQTPLASIRAHVELIETDLPHDSTTARALSAIERGADRLTKLVNNMIWLARVDDPHRQVDTQLVDLVDTVLAVADDAIASGAVVLDNQKASSAGPIPASVLNRAPGSVSGSRSDEARHLTLQLPGAPVWVEGTPSELVLLCCNLVANAIKYTDPGGHVLVQVDHDHDDVELLVQDDGIGVAAHERDLIFEDFYRSHSSAARRRPGTGLGLSIVRRIVARHQGRIAVEPAESGTVFRVYLTPARHTAAMTESTCASKHARSTG